MKLCQRRLSSGCGFVAMLLLALPGGAGTSAARAGESASAAKPKSDSGSSQFSGVHFRQPVGIDPYLGLGNKATSPLVSVNSLARSGPPPPRITTQTVANPPGLSRGRTEVGIYERVNVFAGGYNCKWTVPFRPDSGIIITEPVNPTENGMGTRLQVNVGYRFPNIRVYAVPVAGPYTGKEFSVNFTVIMPTAITATAKQPFWHMKGQPSAGFTAREITIHPKHVSFYAMELQEGTCEATAWGIFRRQNGARHQAGTWWSTFNENNSANFTDEIYTRSILGPIGDPRVGWQGQFTWPIPIQYRGYIGRLNETNKNQEGPIGMVVTHRAEAAVNGRTGVAKLGAYVFYELNAPNQANPGW